MFLGRLVDATLQNHVAHLQNCSDCEGDEKSMQLECHCFAKATPEYEPFIMRMSHDAC